MNAFGYELTIRRKAGMPGAVTPTVPGSLTGPGSGGWFPIIREPFTGAWQQNQEIRGETALSNPYVFACVTLIASDIAKMRLQLVAQDSDGIWHETKNPAYSPVLRKPNRYQTIIKFVEAWIVSKLAYGNAYVLKARDNRGVVDALYVLNPARVRVLVAPDGSVYYELQREDLAGINPGPVVAPASEIIHDLMVALFHPLIGVSPLYACGLAALQGLTIQQSSNTFFANGAKPGGVLSAPGRIGDDTAKRLKDHWDLNYSGELAGKVAVLGDGLKYEPLSRTAVDSQLIEQLKWTAEPICAAYHVPPYMINVGPPPPYANVEPLLQQYYSQCLQSLIASFELSLDEGLGLSTPVSGTQYGTEFDIDDLIWMDTATRTKAAADSIHAGALSPNEARKKYYGVGPAKGGDSPMVQQQYFSLAALAERDAADPFAKPTPAPAAAPAAVLEPGNPDDLAAAAALLLSKNWEGVADAA